MAVPLLAFVEQVAMDGLDGAHVQAAGGLARDDELRLRADFAGEDGLLEVAARQQTGLYVDVRARQCRSSCGSRSPACGSPLRLSAQPVEIGADR